MDFEKTGGPAFPQAEYPNLDQAGMTLRDYFAAKALPVAWDMYKGSSLFGSGTGADTMAECAYQIAAAMLKARQA